jgi:hypothetical protein
MTTQTGGRGEQVNSTPIMNILGSDGTLRLAVPEGTEGAVRRDYETSDGKKGTKWELTFKSLCGRITNMQMFEGDYGKNLLVTLSYEGGSDTISFNTTTPFGEDFMKKLPNINLDEFVTIAPYNFTDEAGKTRKGVTVTQGDTKLQNYFSEMTEKDGEKTYKNLYGYPMPTGKEEDKDDWKIYFTQCRKFLVKNVEEKFLPAYTHMITGTSVDYPTE